MCMSLRKNFFCVIAKLTFNFSYIECDNSFLSYFNDLTRLPASRKSYLCLYAQFFAVMVKKSYNPDLNAS